MTAELIMLTWERFQLINLITGLVCLLAGMWIGHNRDKIREHLQRLRE
jgi:hypothetical protein